MRLGAPLILALLLLSIVPAHAQEQGEEGVISDLKHCYDHLYITKDPQSFLMDPGQEGGACYGPDHRRDLGPPPQVMILRTTQNSQPGVLVVPFGGGQAAFVPLHEKPSSTEPTSEFLIQVPINGNIVSVRFDEPNSKFPENAKLPKVVREATGCDFGKPGSTAGAISVQKSDFTVGLPEVTKALTAAIQQKVEFRMLNQSSGGPLDFPKLKPDHGKQNKVAVEACLNDLKNEHAPAGAGEVDEFHDLRQVLEKADDFFARPAGSTPYTSPDTSSPRSGGAASAIQ